MSSVFRMIQQHLLLISILLLLTTATIVAADENNNNDATKEDEETVEDISKKYLYLAMGPDADPIHEFLEPNIQPNDEDITDITKLMPDFLTNPEGGNRVVEYYAPWCPHCKHFKPTYIKFAKNMTKHAKMDYKMDITFHAISCTVHRKICKHRDVKSYPTVELIPQGQTNGTKIGAWQLHPFTVFKEFGVGIDDLKEEEGAPLLLERIKDVGGEFKKSIGLKGSGSETTMNHFDVYPKTSKEMTYNDAYLSFDFALRQSIFMTNGPLVNKTLHSFENWIDLLNVVLPPSWKMHTVLKALNQEWETIIDSEDDLLKVVNKFSKPPKKGWSDSCKKGDDAMGYTCGLWQLFHIVTVGTIEWNKHSEDEDQRFSMFEVGEVIRNYIANFFACEECRANFLTAYDTCAHDACNRLTPDVEDSEDWKQLPLWLWETHNSVNVRLAKERAERDGKKWTDEQDVLVQWPSRSACPLCWTRDGWDEDVVYKYLRMEYWPDDAATRTFRAQVLASMREAAAAAAPGDNDDDDDVKIMRQMKYIFFSVCIIGALIIGVQYLQKKMKLQRTGRHKKYDLIA